MELQHIEDALVEAGERAKADGIKLIKGDFSKRRKDGTVECMCPMTCLTREPKSTLGEFMAVLGIDKVSDLWDIISGIDGASNAVLNPGFEYYKLGQRVAKRLGL
jgi:hypothetical protein